MLAVHEKKVNILHYVNLHDEIPEGIRARRASNN